MLVGYDEELKQIWEAKERALKRLEELSLKSLGEIPQLDEPNEEQEQWIKRRMRGSARSWEVWDK